MACSATCDPAGYLQQNPDIAAHPTWKLDPCGHYVKFGQYDNPPRTWCPPETGGNNGVVISLPSNFDAVLVVKELTLITIPIIGALMIFAALALARRVMGFCK